MDSMSACSEAVRGILIQTRSRLPEAAIRSIFVHNGELLQEVGSVDLQPGNRPDGYGNRFQVSSKRDLQSALLVPRRPSGGAAH